MPITRPGSSVQRWRRVQAVLLRYGFESLPDKDGIKEARRWLREELNLPLAQIEGRSAPERVRLMLEELGPAYVKLGRLWPAVPIGPRVAELANSGQCPVPPMRQSSSTNWAHHGGLFDR
jgi:ubiquinone biosynthesis protein